MFFVVVVSSFFLLLFFSSSYIIDHHHHVLPSCFFLLLLLLLHLSFNTAGTSCMRVRTARQKTCTCTVTCNDVFVCVCFAISGRINDVAATPWPTVVIFKDRPNCRRRYFKRTAGSWSPKLERLKNFRVWSVRGVPKSWFNSETSKSIRNCRQETWKQSWKSNRSYCM